MPCAIFKLANSAGESLVAVVGESFEARLSARVNTSFATREYSGSMSFAYAGHGAARRGQTRWQPPTIRCIGQADSL